jgi:hypothetical protein
LLRNLSFERDSLVYDPRGKQEVNPERCCSAGC